MTKTIKTFLLFFCPLQSSSVCTISIIISWTDFSCFLCMCLVCFCCGSSIFLKIIMWMIQHYLHTRLTVIFVIMLQIVVNNANAWIKPIVDRNLGKFQIYNIHIWYDTCYTNASSIVPKTVYNCWILFS